MHLLVAHTYLCRVKPFQILNIVELLWKIASMWNISNSIKSSIHARWYPHLIETVSARVSNITFVKFVQNTCCNKFHLKYGFITFIIKAKLLLCLLDIRSNQIPVWCFPFGCQDEKKVLPKTHKVLRMKYLCGQERGWDHLPSCTQEIWPPQIGPSQHWLSCHPVSN